MRITDDELIEKARSAARYKQLSEEVRTGEVGSALITEKDNVYQGSSIHACCGVGFCAEHSAIACMVTNGEFRIKKIVAVTSDGKIVPPCGRCRELILQMDENNLDTDIILGKDKLSKLKELLPNPWQKVVY
jgi:cytidine deaminase